MLTRTGVSRHQDRLALWLAAILATRSSLAKVFVPGFHHTPTPHPESSNFTPDTCSAELFPGSGMRKRSF